tara:strand:- start:1000 stop:1251 length:252 start_codon:yes stop_codon:yes gene_type:complete
MFEVFETKSRFKDLGKIKTRIKLKLQDFKSFNFSTSQAEPINQGRFVCKFIALFIASLSNHCRTDSSVQYSSSSIIIIINHLP